MNMKGICPLEPDIGSFIVFCNDSKSVQIVMRDLAAPFWDLIRLRGKKGVWTMGDAFMKASQGSGFICTFWQPWLHKLRAMNQLSSIIKLKRMDNYSFVLLPSVNYPTLYYYTMPTTTSLEPLPQEPEPVPPPKRGAVSRRLYGIQLSTEDLMAAGYDSKKKAWTSQEDQRLVDLVEKQNIPWKHIQDHMPERTQKMCYSRYRRLITEARQRWAPEDEKRLKELVETRGRFWKEFVKEFPNKSWKNLRDKYVNFLSPDINRDDWTLEEDQKLLELVGKYGTKWKQIQDQMGTRTDNQLKNRFYGRLRMLLKRKARRRYA